MKVTAVPETVAVPARVVDVSLCKKYVVAGCDEKTSACPALRICAVENVTVVLLAGSDAVPARLRSVKLVEVVEFCASVAVPDTAPGRGVMIPDLSVRGLDDTAYRTPKRATIFSNLARRFLREAFSSSRCCSTRTTSGINLASSTIQVFFFEPRVTERLLALNSS